MAHRISDDVLNQRGKQSICYGCDKILRNLSILVCAECLDEECDDFAVLVEKQQNKKGE